MILDHPKEEEQGKGERRKGEAEQNKSQTGTRKEEETMNNESKQIKAITKQTKAKAIRESEFTSGESAEKPIAPFSHKIQLPIDRLPFARSRRGGQLTRPP